jgi:hypothetical protein
MSGDAFPNFTVTPGIPDAKQMKGQHFPVPPERKARDNQTADNGIPA